MSEELSELDFHLKKQQILRIRAQNETQEERRRLNDIDVLCRLLSDDNNNAEFSDFSTIESSRESSDCRQSLSAESVRALVLEESLLTAEVRELAAKPDAEDEDEDLKEFTRIERELRVAELLKCLESVKTQIRDRLERSAPLAESESLCSQRDDREDDRQLRPLTLYMPIAEQELDLHNHIHTLGHDLQSLSPDVVVTRFTCFGYLQKLCQKSENNFRKRFFLFDRKNRTFSYFRSKRHFARNESPKDVVLFDAIHDVYVDHERQTDSRQVFVVGASHRQFVLSTPLAEVMRVWVDVVVTGAQGYQLFDF